MPLPYLQNVWHPWHKRSLWYGHSFHWVVGAVKLWGQEMIRDKARSTEGSEGCDGVRMCVEGKSKCVSFHSPFMFFRRHAQVCGSKDMQLPPGAGGILNHDLQCPFGCLCTKW